jgi:hypothetical protein
MKVDNPGAREVSLEVEIQGLMVENDVAHVQADAEAPPLDEVLYKVKGIRKGFDAQKPGRLKMVQNLNYGLVETDEPAFVQPMPMVIFRDSLAVDDVSVGRKAGSGVDGPKALADGAPTDAAIRISQEDIQGKMDGIGEPGLLTDGGKLSHLPWAREIGHLVGFEKDDLDILHPVLE